MYQHFTFHGVELNTGDTVQVIAGSVPLPFEAAVVAYDRENDVLEVISTQLAIFQHSGKFPSSDVVRIEVSLAYTQGVSMQAREPLHRGQYCRVTVGGVGEVVARVAAAVDGVVYGHIVDDGGPMDGEDVTGGSRFWEPLPLPAIAK